MPPRLSLFPRLRQACRGDRRGPADATSAGARMGQGPSAAADALCGHPSLAGVAGALQGQEPRLVLNRLFLSGILVADPQVDEGRDGDAVALLLVAFPAPDARDTQEQTEVAICEIEVPGDVMDKCGKELLAGESIFVTGQLNGGGGVIATEIHSGPAPDQRVGRGGPPDRS
jgi:hypothetical protein